MRLPKTNALPVIVTLILFINHSSQQMLNGNERRAAAEDTTNRPNDAADREPNQGQRNQSRGTSKQSQVPAPIASASYLSLDGLALVVGFDRPVNLSTSIELVELRHQHTSEREQQVASQVIGAGQSARRYTDSVCLRQSSNWLDQVDQQQQYEATNQQLLIGGIQLCAKLLSKKSLKLLHKYKLHNCLWPSRVQFIVQLRKPVAASASIKIAFQRGVISEFGPTNAPRNQAELALELQRLPLETLGLPLAPQLALTGPNQVPPCGQFSLSAHLWSPFGTWPGESVKLSWSVERLGFVGPSSGLLAINSSSASVAGANEQSPSAARIAQAAELESQQLELRWRTLEQLVSSTKTNNLLLEAQLLQVQPQLYRFRVQVTFSTSTNQVTLNASHQVGRIDFEAPIGTLYGTHMLGQHGQWNTNQDLLLLADIKVPECAANVKQVGLYWQVSDSRVRFEQTYAPFYLARANSLPEQAQIEFRLNLFYGIRVKKFSSAGAQLSTGDSNLEAQISNGLLVISVGRHHENYDRLNGNQQLELFGGSPDLSKSDRFSYQWSCFDGKTAQPCFKSSRVLQTNSTRYELASLASAGAGRPQTGAGEQLPGAGVAAGAGSSSPANSPLSSGLTLIERTKQRQQILRLPLSWLEPDAQLWFGLQRFDQQQAPGQQSPTEYTLVTIPSSQSATPSISIGPVLIGQSRHRATVRNPLTGAIVLIAGAPVVIIGRLGPRSLVKSFAWRSPNYVQPLNWIQRNSTNPLHPNDSDQDELVSELHLNANLQVGHAHYQIQLVACSTSGAVNSATLNLDIVQGVSQCLVEAKPSALVDQSLIVSVDYCNIPLGLSPLTYQLYLADTTGLEGSTTGGGSAQQQQQGNGSSSSSNQENEDDDYMNESDELYLESLAAPLTVPQLSPVFPINGLSGHLLLAMSGQARGAEAGSNGTALKIGNLRARFAARVCDRLQSCKLFYSQPIGIERLLTSGANQQVSPVQVLANQAAAIQSLQSMLEAAKRANLVGNSIAAISILNGAINLAQKLLASSKSSSPQRQVASEREVRRIGELIQVAVRDCLHYGVQSSQRQFHYTESGQTNLVVQTLAKVLSLPVTGANLELRFRAIKLVGQVMRRSLAEQVNLKQQVNCLADSRSLQAVYWALMGSFGQHSVDSTLSPDSVGRLLTHNVGQPLSAPIGASSNNNQPTAEVSASTSNSSGQMWQKLQATTTTTSTISPTAAASRKKREEAILIYLKSIRQTLRSVISAAAIQLPLGASLLFDYNASDGGDSSASSDQDNERAAALSARVRSLARPPQSVNNRSMAPPQHRLAAQLFASASTSSSAAATTTTTTSITPSDSVSSLVHATDLGGKQIDINLHEFGAVSIAFDSRLVQRLRQRRLNCANHPAGAPPAGCASFVLAITTYAGKAPFRSLDEGRSLRMPIVEIALLSPLDGSNLLERAPSSQTGDQLDELESLRTTITFAAPESASQEPTPSAQAGGQHNSKRRGYKCYQFDELSNEWFRPSSSERPELDELISGEPFAGEPDNDQPQPQAQQSQPHLRRVRCTFSGLNLGAFATFQGRPPPIEGSLIRQPVMLGLLAILTLIILFSLLGCCATRYRSDKSATSSSSSHQANRRHNKRRPGELEDEEDVDANGRQHKTNGRTFRDELNYPAM